MLYKVGHFINTGILLDFKLRESQSRFDLRSTTGQYLRFQGYAGPLVFNKVGQGNQAGLGLVLCPRIGNQCKLWGLSVFDNINLVSLHIW